MGDLVHDLLEKQAELDVLEADLKARRSQLRRTFWLWAAGAVSFATQAWPGGLGYVLAWVGPWTGLFGALGLRGVRRLRRLQAERDCLAISEAEAPGHLDQP